MALTPPVLPPKGGLTFSEFPGHFPSDISPKASREEQRLHSLDVRWFFTYREPGPFGRPLFMAITDRMRCEPGYPPGSPPASVCAITWQMCHPHAYSTRSQVSSAAFVAQVPILDVCKAATWSFIHTFSSHCAVTQQARNDVAFGQAVL